MEKPTAEKAYRVLARKYRPESFADLIGQEPMVRTLTNAFETGRIAQAWMLTGVRGVGKTTTARILARALNYKTATIDRPTIDFTEPGEHCQAIMEGRDVDVVEMDAASHTGIDDIRDIIEQVRYRPVAARYKIYIIDEVHMLSTQAFNGLLKTLEEPPPHVKFIFATTEIRKVPITVLSRCQRFDLRRIDAAALTGLLRKISNSEKIEADDKALAMIARAAEGSARDALSMLDQAIAHGDEKVSAEAVRSMLGLADRARIIDLFELIMRGDVAGALREFESQYDAGADPVVALTDLADFNHLVTRLRFTPELAHDVSLAEEERQKGLDFAKNLSVRVLSRNWQMLLKGIEEVDRAARPMQAAEMLIIRLTHAADLPSLDETLKAIQNGTVPNGIMQNGGGQNGGAQNNSQHHAKIAQDAPAPTSRAEAASTPPAEIPAISQPNTLQQNASQQNIMQNASEPVMQHVAPSTMTENSINHETRAANGGMSTNNAMAAISTLTAPLESPAFNTAFLATAPLQDNVAEPNLPERTIEAAPKGGIIIRSFDDIIRIASEKREIKFKILLREYVRLVSFKPKRIEFEMAEGGPRNLASDMTKMLKEWTGEHWGISVVNEGGAMTLAEEERAERETLFASAEADPHIQATLNAFPGAKVVDVRLMADALEKTNEDEQLMQESDELFNDETNDEE